MEIQYLQKMHLLLNLVQENFYQLSIRGRNKEKLNKHRTILIQEIQGSVQIQFKFQNLIKFAVEISHDLVILNDISIHFIQFIEPNILIVADKDMLLNFFVTLFVYIFS